jgi:Kdo2-lipid IVA lauroyltransferase/acyltransferase
VTRLAIGLLWLLARLPPAARRCTCERLAAAFMHVARERREVARRNLRLCFPDLADATREELLRHHFRALGRGLALACTAWFRSPDEIRAAVRVEGLAHLHAEPDRPRILLVPHFVSLDTAAIRLSLESDAVAIYSTQKDPVFDRFLVARRTRFRAVRLIPREAGIRPALRALREGLPLFLQPDLDFGPRDSIFVPFFGVATATTAALPRLARITGAAVLPVIAEQTPDGVSCVVRIHPPIEGFPGSSPAADTRRMNAMIEVHVRRIPEQYWWIHKRFKTRPPGAPPVYQQKHEAT